MSMRERNRILELWDKLRAQGEPGVLATVVRTEGSSYRLPGARLLLAPDGRRAGSVSGGCLEDDVIKKAWWLTAKGPMIRRYDTTAEGDARTDGYGLGCNGVVYLLLEQITAQQPSLLPLIEAAVRLRRPCTVAHRLTPADEVGQRVILANQDDASHFPEDEYFLERISPPVHLLVFGAGDDAPPLTELAAFLGWEVSVFDGRSHYARAEKFPHAGRVAVRSPGESAPKVDPWTVAVVMTHSYSQDLDVLRTLLPEPLPYLGVLGPRKRTVQLLAELNESGPAEFPQLRSPMGLDLGADGPEQVAIAVTAEIQAVLNARDGGFLRDRLVPIHGHTNPADSDAKAWVRSIVCA